MRLCAVCRVSLHGYRRRDGLARAAFTLLAEAYRWHDDDAEGDDRATARKEPWARILMRRKLTVSKRK